ncbi:uncharacterized protein V1510DRAFT_404669 [Dipodascopsis tothii]|uniref:uncharacterized protein n=1 Tax=Dipodascopsis tothii TaxID=44089 RepID=UPI0034CDFBE9
MSRREGGRPPPRRAPANPAPKTEAAKQALRSFYCDLCQKGYSRMDEYDTHISSYEHQHRKRFVELRQMQRDPAQAAARREREEREAGMRSLALDAPEAPPAAGFKPVGAGFKRIGLKRKEPAAEPAAAPAPADGDSDYEHYDPRFPTD